jgi:hypothetical protein
VICDPQSLATASSPIRALTDGQLAYIKTFLYCRYASHYMAIDCSAQGLANAAQQFECCLPDGLNRYAQTYLLAQILAALVPGTSTDPSVIANQARCFDCGFGNELAMQSYLLCQIVTALGG